MTHPTTSRGVANAVVRIVRLQTRGTWLGILRQHGGVQRYPRLGN